MVNPMDEEPEPPPALLFAEIIFPLLPVILKILLSTVKYEAPFAATSTLEPPFPAFSK